MLLQMGDGSIVYRDVRITLERSRGGKVKRSIVPITNRVGKLTKFIPYVYFEDIRLARSEEDKRRASGKLRNILNDLKENGYIWAENYLRGL